MRMISFLRHRKTLWTIFQYDACVGQDLSLKYDSEKVSCLKATRFQIQVRHLEKEKQIKGLNGCMIIFCVLIIITLLSYLSLMMLLIGKVLRRFQFEKKR